MFFYKRPLFFLEFKRFRFKKIKKFRHLNFCKLRKTITKKSNPKKIILLKKNASNFSLQKSFLKKSLYTNKFFRSRFFFFKKKVKFNFFFKKKKFKKKTLSLPNKFFLKYIKIERTFFLKMFGLKNKNQKSTTRFTLIPHKYNPLEFKKFIELSLINVLIRAKFSLSKKHSLSLIKLNSVYVNYTKINRPFFVLKKNDLIQLIFVKSFFFFINIYIT